MTDDRDLVEDARRLLQQADADLKAAGKLLSIARAAKVADVQPKTVRRWFHSGKLPGLQSATGRIRIPENALAAFLSHRA